jgi:hypothetical protein
MMTIRQAIPTYVRVVQRHGGSEHEPALCRLRPTFRYVQLTSRCSMSSIKQQHVWPRTQSLPYCPAAAG